MKMCAAFILATISIFNLNSVLICLPPFFGEAFVDKHTLKGMMEVWCVSISVLGLRCF